MAIAALVLAQFARVLPQDPKARRQFVTSNGLKKVRTDVCVCLCVRACVREFLCVRARVCVHMHVCMGGWVGFLVRLCAWTRYPMRRSSRSHTMQVQEIKAEPGSQLAETIAAINACFPEEIVKYYSPGYSEALLQRVDAFQPTSA
jgi:hypothetical protein